MSDPLFTDDDIRELLLDLNSGKAVQDQLCFDSCRLAAINGFQDVQACPGSGKTTLVTLKLLLIARRWGAEHSGVCVLTHSNVAKQEIITKLRRHPSGFKLCAFPHFIGTIQDFVDTFLALPYARSRGWEPRLFDQHAFSERLVSDPVFSCKVFDRKKGKKYSLRYFVNADRLSVQDLFLVHNSGGLRLNQKFFDELDKVVDLSKSKLNRSQFKEMRRRGCEQGLFQYREMYALAEQLMVDNPSVLATIRSRFPIVLMDETQDTQKFQDDLLNRVFTSEACRFQRFGDPDQSIFDGIGGAEPNITFNSGSLVPIIESHRFSPDIASKIAGLSHSRLSGLKSSRKSLLCGPPNTIILFDDASIQNVIREFSELVSQLPIDRRRMVKAVGSVGESFSSTLTIRNYWPDFCREKPANVSSPATLCEAVKRMSESRTGHVADLYSGLIESILECLRRSGQQAAEYDVRNARTLKRYLRENGTEASFRQLLTRWTMKPLPTKDQWEEDVAELKRQLNLSGLNDKLREYLSYSTSVQAQSAATAPEGHNVLVFPSGVRIIISTIHGVKGETHDATLVLETKHRLFDLKEIVKFLCDPSLASPVYDAAHPTNFESLRACAMKRLYVAASRPKYLLCFAIHKDHVTNDQKNALSEKGWSLLYV